MNNKKKKKFYYVFSGCCVIIFVVLAIVATYLDGAELFELLKAMIVLSIVALVGYMRAEYLEEKDNPLSLKKIKVAVAYIVELKQGTKDEFVKEFSLIMYEHLQKIGFIHQIKDFRITEEKWEITEYCLKKAKNY